MGDQSISSLSYGQLVNALTKLGRAGVTARIIRRLGQDEDFLERVFKAITAADHSLEDCVAQHHLSVAAGETRMTLYEELLSRYNQSSWYLLKEELVAGLSQNGDPPSPEQMSFFDTQSISIILVPMWERMSLADVKEELVIRGLVSASANDAILYANRFGLMSYRNIYVPAARIKIGGKIEILSVSDGVRLWEWDEIPRGSFVMAKPKLPQPKISEED